jgi:hypothetical protein
VNQTSVIRPRSARRISLAVLVVGSMGALAACGGSGSAAPEPTASVPQSVAPSTAPPPPPVTSPLTGLPGEGGDVLAVKIDNTASALPHVGLTSADNVYIERVEGGLTRLVAIFASKKPEVVVPVRSARETDAELLQTYGKIPVAFSGSVGAVHTALANAGLSDISADKGGLGYYRVSGRPAPYNLAGDPKVLIKRAKKVEAKDIGLTFGDAPVGGKKATAVSVRFPALVSFDYKASTNRWVYKLGGRVDQVPGKAAASASTVVVQYVTIGVAGRNDTASHPVPFTKSVGKGKGVVLRDGKSYNVKWSRPTAKSPTTWTYKGEPFPMVPGQTWFVLADKNSPATITR